MSGVPGSAVQIQTAADAWRSAGARLSGAVDEVKKADPESWQGEAATAFRAKEASLVADVVATGEALAAASRLLASYASVLAGLSAKGADLHHSRGKAEARVARNPLDLLAYLEILSLRLAESSLVRQAQSAADETARQLVALVESDVGGNQHWWDPFGWWDDEAVPDESVNKHTLDDTNWDPAVVQQGSIGDCYALSTIMGYMRTDQGRALMTRNVRWDREAGGYWVTLYAHGEPTEYFVDKVYEQGVNQFDGKTMWWENTSPSVVSLYESALAEQTTFSDINDGGYATSAIEAISGRDAVYVATSADPRDHSLTRMSDAVNSGSSVVASSRSGNGMIPLSDVSIERPDGTMVVTDVEIVQSHAYDVERVADDGSVWVRNPWGPGNGADGGGLMHLTQDQFIRGFVGASFEEAS